MRRIVVPGYDLAQDGNTVLLEWETDSTGLRAVFTREGDRLALNHVEERTRPPAVLDGGLELVPRALVRALQRHGYTVVVPEADDGADGVNNSAARDSNSPDADVEEADD